MRAVDILVSGDGDLDKRVGAATTRLGASFSAQEYKKEMEPLTKELIKQLSDLEKKAPEDLKSDATALKKANEAQIDLIKKAGCDLDKIDDKQDEAAQAKIDAAVTDVTAWHEKQCK